MRTLLRSLDRSHPDYRAILDEWNRSAVLSTVLALATLLLGLAFPGQGLATPGRAFSWLLQVVVCTLISYLFYQSSIPRASGGHCLRPGATGGHRLEDHAWSLVQQGEQDMRVILEVKNPDPARQVQQVVVTDTLLLPVGRSKCSSWEKRSKARPAR